MEKNVERYLEKRAEDIRNHWEDDVCNFIESWCESPIEKLFFIEWKYQTEGQKENQPKSFPNFYIMSQREIAIGNKKYRVDFLIYYVIDDGWMVKESSLPKNHKNQALIIELDSYLYHGSDPDQFTKEKERERELQRDGWKIMRFSGREVVRDIEKCVDQVIEYFNSIKKRICKEGI